jgi:hypothetical protein
MAAPPEQPAAVDPAPAEPQDDEYEETPDEDDDEYEGC